MAELHDKVESKYRARLGRKGFAINNRPPFVDYRPDIFATNSGGSLFVEVEISQTLESPHTTKQLRIMHKYLQMNRRDQGVLVVPRSCKRRAQFLLRMLFGQSRISVDSF